ncbi:ABC transporter permease subunit [Succinivibrio dextrinosolvens]|uniref:ABC transporter permease subunit n=1 Tax=Succinivibrio dextrinosolvens TaxID=83771 RepID=UPI001922CE8A|nr:ABC transporter permease subunit [Succinivibrio dextrinosolvens]
MILNKNTKSTLFRFVILTITLIFLYLPIMTLVVYSFNESKMVTVWTNFSLKWYRALMNNDAIITAVGISMTIAVMSAIASVIIGTLAAFVMVRIKKFTGESAFLLFMTAPMILPEVITGLALLLLFVTLGDIIPVFSDRGMITIWIAHVTFCSAYATVVIRSRFVELDVSIEEAAKDLGAGPMKVFFVIILPAIMPAEVAAFLLSFTMSMDDLVIASFVAGPNSTTLPMLIFSSVRRGLSPEINALASVIVFVVSIFAFVSWVLTVRKQKRKERNAAMVKAALRQETTITA